MEKKVFAVYESSRGRKDLVYLTDDLTLATANARGWTKLLPDFKYRIYEIPLNVVVDMSFNKYNQIEVKPREIKF